MSFTTPLIATIDMDQARPVGELTLAYLKRCGYSTTKIDSWTSETRLLHDLGLCGDDLLDEFKILQDEFGVDLSEFEFKKYFPGELSMDAYFITIRQLLRAVGLGKVVDHVCDKYTGISLGMIESAIRQRKWISSVLS
jgi:hypothetical protein